jgi:large conductance mechanosensitive channel
MWKEFKEFAVKGNALDLAIGVIIGAAFGKIVSSIVNDLIMPIVSLITGRIAFQDLFIALDGKHYDTYKLAKEAGAPLFAFGLFITTVIDFLIVAFVVFLMVKQINRLKLKPKPAEVVVVEPTEKDCPYCYSKVNIKASKCPHCTSDLN